MDHENTTCWDDGEITDVVRLVITFGVGSTMCLIGISMNTFLLLVFSRLSFHNNNFLYLYILAFFDIVVELCFILIFSVGAYYDYFRNYELYVVWHWYLRVASTTGQVLILASTMIIVAASFERYICSGRTALGFTPRQRVTSIVCVIIYAMAVKGTVFVELEVQYLPECDHFSDWHAALSHLTTSEWYQQFWMFYIRNIFSVFLPFILLTLLNSATIKNLNKTSKHFESILLEGTQLQLPSLLHLPPEAASARQRKRDATRTLAVLVSVYLLTNATNVFLTFWEHIDHEALKGLGGGWPYRYLADTSSLICISGTAVRLPIYYTCNREIRAYLREYVKECATKEKTRIKQESVV